MPEVLHYPGDRTAFDPDWIMGPDTDRRYVRVVKATYDAVADRTTCTMRAILPADFREMVGKLQGLERSRDRIRKLFNG